MRGENVRAGLRDGGVVRNIPTCVGKTKSTLTLRTANTEHPHVRGENAARKGGRKIQIGTSPRAWGKQRESRSLSQRKRNIPTCVGKTDKKQKAAEDMPEHPHVRGENCPGQRG